MTGGLIWKAFKRKKLSLVSLSFLCVFFVVGVYAPVLASSKPLVVEYEGSYYFPLGKYLFYTGFYSKPLDLFYNVLMFTLPLFVLAGVCLRGWGRKAALVAVGFAQAILFVWFACGAVKNPESDAERVTERRFEREERQLGDETDPVIDWNFELKHMTPYQKLNLLTRYKQRREQKERLEPYLAALRASNHRSLTLWEIDEKNRLEERAFLEKAVEEHSPAYEKALFELPTLEATLAPLEDAFTLITHEVREKERHGDAPAEIVARHATVSQEKGEAAAALQEARSAILRLRAVHAKLKYLEEKTTWLEEQSSHLHVVVTPFLRPFHWEDDAGGSQMINAALPWWELTRLQRKDLTAALLFGIRVSLLVGTATAALALLIALPLGATAGYFAGTLDIILCRLIEIWEGMPAFFMLLLIIALLQTKSLLLVILTLALFGWTQFARFMRSEVLRQRALPYILAGKALGFSSSRIMLSHVLPNAIPPILTLLPFSMMAAITSEAGLSFLGLGEEGSTSWGVLMAEGRSVFPAESYLLWPPALLLTCLLVSIALVGDALRDALDPKSN